MDDIRGTTVNLCQKLAGKSEETVQTWALMKIAYELEQFRKQNEKR